MPNVAAAPSNGPSLDMRERNDTPFATSSRFSRWKASTRSAWTSTVVRAASFATIFAVTCGQCTTVRNRKYAERANTAGARLQRMPSVN